jgi:hypothetical protein
MERRSAIQTNFAIDRISCDGDVAVHVCCLSRGRRHSVVHDAFNYSRSGRECGLFARPSPRLLGRFHCCESNDGIADSSKRFTAFHLAVSSIAESCALHYPRRLTSEAKHGKHSGNSVSGIVALDGDYLRFDVCLHLSSVQPDRVRSAD